MTRMIRSKKLAEEMITRVVEGRAATKKKKAAAASGAEKVLKKAKADLKKFKGKVMKEYGPGLGFKVGFPSRADARKYSDHIEDTYDIMPPNDYKQGDYYVFDVSY